MNPRAGTGQHIGKVGDRAGILRTVTPASTHRHVPRRASIFLPVVLVAALSGCSSSSASSRPPAPVTSTSEGTFGTVAGGTAATGSVTCTDVTGGITFYPPLVNAGTSPETTSIVLSVSGCTPTGSNVSQVAGARATAIIQGADNSCTGLLTSRPIAVAFAWSPSSIHASLVSFSGFSLPTDAAGHVGFALPDKGGSASVAGSFGGTNGGASSSGSTFSSLTVAQLHSTCDTTAGLTSLTFVNGTVTLS